MEASHTNNPQRNRRVKDNHFEGTSALKELEKLYFKDRQEKHPNVPEYAVKRPQYNDKTANGLTRCIIDYVRFIGGQAERISVMGKKVVTEHTYQDPLGNKRKVSGERWIKGNMQPGSADISTTIKGRSVKVEVKIGRDRQSKEQRLYQQQIEKAGGVYIIAKDFEGFVRSLKYYKLI